MALHASFADADATDEFNRFRCWDGDPDTPWIEEAENYVRVSVLGDAEFVLAIRDDQEHLVAVAAFDYRIIEVPIVRPQQHAGWHLQVVALDLELQGMRLSGEVFQLVFDAMTQVDADRVLVTAHVHIKHAASLAACQRVGLTVLKPLDEHYDVLLGEVPKG